MNMLERFIGFPFLRQETTKGHIPPSGSPERGKNERYFRNFELPAELNNKLSENDRTISFYVLEAAELGERIFARQEGDSGRPNFFPKDATKKEIIAAAQNQKDTPIDDHYTVVVRDQATGNLTAKPFHLHYPEISQMAEFLKKAANAAGNGRERDPSLQVYLRAISTAFITGNYEPVAKYWLQRDDEPKIDVVLGFYDANTDTVLGRKFSFEAWINFLNPRATQDAQQFTDSFLKWWGETTGQKTPGVRARYGYDLAITGQAVKYRWTANSLPCQPEWRAKYGSKFTIFGSVFEDSMPEIWQALKNTIDPGRRVGVDKVLVKKVALRQLIAHETSHSLGIEEGFDKRFREHATWVAELYCDLLALVGYSQLKGLSPREAEISLAVTLANGRLEYNIFKREGRRQEYYISNSILLKYLLDQDAVRIVEGRLTWEHPSKIFSQISNLFTMVQKLLKDGRARDAEMFLQGHFDPEIYSKVVYRDRPLLYTPNEPLGLPRES